MELIYLDTYVLQRDMRIRMPKAILANLPVKEGETKFAIYLDKDNEQIVLKIDESKEDAKYGA